MDLNFIGLAAATATFLGIWMGHVLVRIVEYKSTSLILPSACFTFLGLFLEIGSFLSDSLLVSAVLGILGTTAFWDSYELARQQKRTMKGHAPANPRNLRHVRILKEYASATTLDLLKRDPLGRETNLEEARKLVAANDEAK